jgi:nucleotide-binding universal stress UspA family protein
MSMSTFERILVPTDFSPPSDHALEVAINLARKLGARLVLLHVWSMPYTAYSEGLNWPMDEMERAAKKELDDLHAETVKVYPATDAILRAGFEASAILEIIDIHAIDLVVMGTHGRRGLPRLLVGSVAERVVRLSPVPVMTVSAGYEKKSVASAP